MSSTDSDFQDDEAGGNTQLSLPDEYRPTAKSGIIKPLLALITGIISATITAFWSGLASIPAAISEGISNVIASVTSWIAEIVESLFGLTAYAGGVLAVAQSQLGQFGFLAYPVGIVVIALTLWVTINAVQSVRGVFGDGT